jgi:hypothetical protein
MNQSEALALLNSLGDTPEQVADSLLAQKITGVPGSSILCPISYWLRSRGVINAHTNKIMIKIYQWNKAGPVSIPEDIIIRPLPEAISQFINMFDQGKFPNLETK